MKIDGIGFDLGDTLYEYAEVPLSWEREYPHALALVADAVDCELTSERREQATTILLRYNTRHHPREHEVSIETIVGEILDAWHCPDDRWQSAARAFFSHFGQQLRAFPDAVEILHRLDDAGIRNGVFTDVPYGMPRDLVLADIERAGLPLGDAEVLTSVDIGRRKPHPLGVIELAGVLGVDLPAFGYVGNERKDVDAARAAGCLAVLLWRGVGEAPRWGQDVTLRSLLELSNKLHGPLFPTR